MCGIVGDYALDAGKMALDNLEAANRIQRSRGPDGSGVFQRGSLGLAHRRLSVFDLSDRASQPMVDEGLGLALVFNGAIYNFKKLRAELVAKGYAFSTNGDTEVVLRAFHAWGKGCVKRFEGMFAFAIHDFKSGELVLARDRMGIKPLYFAHGKKGFHFASTLPALLAFDDIDRSIDDVGLQYYLCLHAVPEPLTILKGIRKLAPGTVMTIAADGTETQDTYWRFRMDEAHTYGDLSLLDWVDAAQVCLRGAVERQLAADVPAGVLLSGGSIRL